MSAIKMVKRVQARNVCDCKVLIMRDGTGGLIRELTEFDSLCVSNL